MTAPSSARVLMTADAVGGVWTYALDLARGLAEAGVGTTLVALGPDPSDDQAREASAIPRLELIETALPLDWMARESAEILEVGAVVRGLARRVGADLIHLNSPALAAGGGFSAPVVGVCHSCLATWWSAVRDGVMPEDFRWRSRALWRGLTACDTLIAPTRAFAVETARAYDVPRPHVVHNGRASPRTAAARRERAVMTAGRLWDDGKNVAVLDEAAARLDAPLYAAGPLRGPAGQTVDLRHARALGRLSAEEVVRRLAHAAVFASAALYEPFGLTVLEAAQAGCALVLSDIPTFRELWSGAALFLPPNDPDGWAGAINGLLADPNHLGQLSTAARLRARRYGLQAMTAGTLAVYRTVQPCLPALPFDAVAA